MCARYLIYLWPVLLAGLLAGCEAIPVQPEAGGEVVKKTTAAPPPPPEAVKPKPVPRRPAVTKKPAPVPVECGIKLTKTKEKLADDYFLKADRFFNKDQPQKAKDALKTALCLNSGHQKAKDLLGILLQVYPDK